MFILLQTVSGILALYNKILINNWIYEKYSPFLKRNLPKNLTTKSFGWMSGILAVILTTIYFFTKNQDFKVMIVYNYALITLLFYGYIIVKVEESQDLKKQKILRYWEMKLKVIVITLTIITCLWILTREESNPVRIIQFYATVFGLTGTLLLSLKKNVIGWILYFITHLLSAYAMIKNDSLIICVFQIISAIVAIFGILHKENKNVTPVDY